ncbi:hypothetical protein C8Q72DRAFT_347184 [Fomitopsis betulina]|nr:hypothetical protein C8Q72DRAFT_347184 [Fomitopsis betulina]
MDTTIFTCTVLTDLIVIVVTWCRTYKVWLQGLRSGNPSPLMILILRGGIVHFVTILVINILELVVMRVWVNASSENVAYTSYVLVPISSILINHFLVDLRQLSPERIQDDSSFPEVCLTSGPGPSGPFLLSLDCHCIGDD